MKWCSRSPIVFILNISVLVLIAYCPAAISAEKAKKVKSSEPASAMETWSKPNAAFDASKMGDMSGWDPANWVNPEGDVIKIAVTWPHSGPGAGNGGTGLGLCDLCRLRYQSAGRHFCGRQAKEGCPVKGRYDVQAGPDQEDLRTDGPPGRRLAFCWGLIRQQSAEGHQRSWQSL